jgi:hypothetical protein
VVGRNNSAISDRSGIRFKASEMVVEPGTGYYVHKDESDGKYNLVDHPLNHVQKYVDYGDPFPAENVRTEQNFTTILPLLDWDGKILTDEFGDPIFLA